MKCRQTLDWLFSNINKISFIVGIGFVAFGYNDVGVALIKGVPQ